jgi:dTMP kinase
MSAPPTSGRFIVFEGGEASGKTTQAAVLSRAIDAVLTHEPGGTDLGVRLRSLLLDPDGAVVGDRTEALMMAADRAQHVAELIRPTLDSGRHVVCDRFTGSTLAYQGYGRGLPLAELEQICDWAAEGAVPDLVVLLDVPDDVARERLTGSPDRLEAAGDAFHQRVRAGYRALADQHRDAWCVVDGTPPVDEVAAQIAAVVRDRLGIPVVGQ